MYIYERKSWSHFTWNTDKIQNLITKVLLAESSLFTILEQLGFDIKMDSFATALTDEIIKSSEIEGVILNTQEVRSSIINKLNLQNIDNNYSSQTSRYVDGIVEMALDETHNYKEKLTEKRLFGWHATLFPTGYSGMYQINVEYNNFSLNPRQKKIISMLLDNFKGNLTSSKYAIICKCSQDTAIRDLSSLMSYGIITKIGNARNIHYELKNKII